ncbi:MAG TPA: hypothetical protein VD766_13560 [Solirubrobacterales bacterium]|nr:hypothetical protein [Solirubrobacterales bacterium]
MRSIWVPAAEPSPGRLRVAAVLALSIAALAGCGDSGGDDEAGAEPVGQELAGSVSQLASCSDWDGATEAEKLATIEDVRSQVNAEDSGVESIPLTDDQAMEVFDNGCDRPEAQGFRLYLLYARAVAFQPLRDIASGEVEAPAP